MNKTLLSTIKIAMLTMLVACSNTPIKNDTLASEEKTEIQHNEIKDTITNANQTTQITAKIAINIEGIVTTIDDNKITLENGKVVIINSDTVFEIEKVGNFIEVDRKIKIGNYIQGFTFDNAENDEVVAHTISSNGKLAEPMGDVAVNIEGIIIEISEDGKSFLLDTGKWVIITDNTEMGITGPTAIPKNEQFFESTFRVGNSIAGFTENEHADKLIAYAIYTNWNWEDPVR